MFLIRCFRVLEWLNNSLTDENASSISVWWKRISKKKLKFFKKLSEMKLVVVKKVRYQFYYENKVDKSSKSKRLG